MKNRKIAHFIAIKDSFILNRNQPKVEVYEKIVYQPDGKQAYIASFKDFVKFSPFNLTIKEGEKIASNLRQCRSYYYKGWHFFYKPDNANQQFSDD